MKVKKSIFTLILLFFLVGCSSVSVNRDEKLSMYFSMKEAIASSTATRYGIDNTPNWQELANIKYTAIRLDEVRRILGRPVQVTSWFRGKKLNKMVKGSSTSSHRKGLAVDILLKKGRAGEQEFQKIKKEIRSFDQIIYYPKRGHLHIGFKTNIKKERKQVMIMR